MKDVAAASRNRPADAAATGKNPPVHQVMNMFADAMDAAVIVLLTGIPSGLRSAIQAG